MLVAEFILGNVSSTHCTLLTNQPSATPTVGKRREPTNQGQVEGQHDYVVGNEYNNEYSIQITDLAPASEKREAITRKFYFFAFKSISDQVWMSFAKLSRLGD